MLNVYNIIVISNIIAIIILHLPSNVFEVGYCLRSNYNWASYSLQCWFIIVQYHIQISTVSWGGPVPPLSKFFCISYFYLIKHENIIKGC